MNVKLQVTLIASLILLGYWLRPRATAQQSVSPARKIVHSMPSGIPQEHLQDFPAEDFQSWVASPVEDKREAYRSIVSIAELLQDQLREDKRVLYRGY